MKKKSPTTVVLAFNETTGRFVGMSRWVFRSVRRSMQRRDAGRWDGKVVRA